MSDPSSQPTQPLTDEELARTMLARRRGAVQSLNGCDCMQPDSHGIVLDSLGDIPRLLAEVSRLRAENTALAAKATSAWSEGSAHALGQVLDHEDQFRANLGVLLVAEERRCQLAINEEPLNFHLHGHLSGLKRARDIVTGDAFRALGLDQDGRGQ